MLRKVSILMVIVLVFSACQLQGAVINSSWVGDEGLWGNANNWDPNIVPDNDGNTFAVTIDAGLGEVEVGLQQSRTIDQLDCYGEVELASWAGWVELTLVDANGLTNYGWLGIEEIEITGNITNTAGAELELCDMDVEGNLYNQAGATIEVECENDVEDDIQNDGTLVIGHASDILVDGQVKNTGQIQIYGGECGVDEIVDNNSTGTIAGFGILYVDQLLRNKGQIYAYGGSLAVACEEGPLLNSGILGNHPLSSLHTRSATNVNNQGKIQVNTGGVVFDCNLINDTNGIIELRGGTLAATSITQTADANFAGFGSITGDVIIDPNGLIELTGPTNIIGDVNIPAGATLRISDGQTLITDHTTCDGTIHLIGGTVIFQSGCDCEDCNIINEAGLDRNHFDINADGIVNLRDFAGFANTWLWQATWY